MANPSFVVPEQRDIRLNINKTQRAHALQFNGHLVEWFLSGIAERGAFNAYPGTLLSYSGSSAEAHANNCAAVFRDAGDLLPRACAALMEGLGQLQSGVTSASSPSFALDAAQPGSGVTGAAGSAPLPAAVAMSRASIKASVTLMIADLQRAVDALTAGNAAI